MKDLDGFIRGYTAGLPPEQAAALGRIIEVLMARPEVPLTDMERLGVLLDVERLLSKKKQAEIERRRLLRNVDQSLEFAKWVRKNIWSKQVRDPPTAIEAVRKHIFRNPDDPESRFPTIEALEQFIKRERKKKSRR
jgi:hypothetical protein